MVIAPVEVADLGLLLRDLRRWSCSRVRIGALEPELARVHVVLLPALHGRSRKGARPPEEHAQDDVACVVNVEHVLPCHEVLGPEVLPERRTAVIGYLEGSVKAATLG